jgi:hypothetical protein
MGPDMSQIKRPGYKVNGWEFHSKEYNRSKRANNTGVCVLGDCADELGRAFYGELEEIIEFNYKGTYGGHINLFKCRWFDSEKGLKVDRHGIIDVDVHMSTYQHAPFVLPTQTSQVYYTRSPGRKRVRPPADWQVVIHIPARTRAQPTENEVYQEDILRSPSTILVEPENDINLVHSGVEGVEVDRDSLNVPDVVQLFSEVESEPEEDGEEDDGYESPPANETDDTSTNEEE